MTEGTEQRPGIAAAAQPGDGGEEFLSSLMDTELYSIGAFFCDQHPELVDEVVETSAQIESEGLGGFASGGGIDLEEAFNLLLTGLAVRYYKAVTG